MSMSFYIAYKREASNALGDLGSVGLSSRFCFCAILHSFLNWHQYNKQSSVLRCFPVNGRKELVEKCNNQS